MKASFITYFTSAFGILWMGFFYLSLCVSSNMQIGLFVMIGFPLLSLIYALCRKALGKEAINPAIARIKEPCNSAVKNVHRPLSSTDS